MRNSRIEFSISATGLESMANVWHHYDASKWYQSRYMLVVRYNQPSDIQPGRFVHTMEYVRHV